MILYTKGDFKTLWSRILSDKSLKFVTNNSNPQNDDIQFDKPTMQQQLTDGNSISSIDLDFSKYSSDQSLRINGRNLYECFHGILHYIYYYSSNKFNINEVEFFFTGGQNRQSYDTIINNNNLNQINQWNIVNIFNYEDTYSQFRVNCARDAIFGFTLKRIKVKPLAYAIRSGSFPNSSTYLISFVFEGLNEDLKNWEVIDERVNINDLVTPAGYALFYVRTTEKCYSSFRIRQTEPGSSGFWGFSIAGLEIHGSIFLKDQNFVDQNESLCETDNQTVDPFEKFDPYMDISDFIF